jgi:hypothetical protein
MCKSYLRDQNELEARVIVDVPGEVYRRIAYSWVVNNAPKELTFAPKELAFAIASAFKLNDHSQPSTLVTTHILVLYCKFKNEEERERDKIEIVGGGLTSREEFFDGPNGVDGKGYLQGDSLREEFREFLSIEGLAQYARKYSLYHLLACANVAS